MARHSVIGRLGPADKDKLSVRSGDVVTNIDLIKGRRRLDFGLGDALDQLRRLRVIPSENAIDLALLGAIITAADTRISRDDDGQDGWSREIDLYLPVSRLDTWMDAAPLLKRTLDFLTGDRWQIRFRARAKGYERLSLATPTLLQPLQTSVCLFSGGLDSFIGVINLVADKKECPVLISHYWDGTTSQVQRDTYALLRARFGSATPPQIRARVGFEKSLFAGHPNEPTLRARSFMFFALASLAASALQGNTPIFVPENGLISLNVPLDPLRVGALSTRTTHPYYINRWTDLLAALSIDATLVNPYQFKTKGEMVDECGDKAFLSTAAWKTMSCSSPNKQRWNGKGPEHCGYCVPCLIRRASLLRGLGTDKTPYTEDLWSAPISTRSKVGQHVRSFQAAYAKLLKRPDLARTHIHQSGPLFEFADDLPKFERVYSEGLAEVGKLLAKVRAEP